MATKESTVPDEKEKELNLKGMVPVLLLCTALVVAVGIAGRVATD